jgi:hypothetical protein
MIAQPARSQKNRRGAIASPRSETAVKPLARNTDGSLNSHAQRNTLPGRDRRGAHESRRQADLRRLAGRARRPEGVLDPLQQSCEACVSSGVPLWQRGMIWADGWRCLRCDGGWHLDFALQPAQPGVPGVPMVAMAMCEASPVSSHRVGLGSDHGWLGSSRGLTLSTRPSRMNSESIPILSSATFSIRTW